MRKCLCVQFSLTEMLFDKYWSSLVKYKLRQTSLSNYGGDIVLFFSFFFFVFSIVFINSQKEIFGNWLEYNLKGHSYTPRTYMMINDFKINSIIFPLHHAYNNLGVNTTQCVFKQLMNRRKVLLSIYNRNHLGLLQQIHKMKLIYSSI